MEPTAIFSFPRSLNVAAPTLPDLDTGLLYHWSSLDLSQVGGSNISHWYDRVEGADLSPIPAIDPPTYAGASLGGLGAVAFDYADDGSTTFQGLNVGTPTLQGPMTYAAVFYNRTVSGGTPNNPQYRLMTGNQASDFIMLGNRNANAWNVGVTFSGNVQGAFYAPGDGELEDSWAIAVAVVEDGESRIYVNDAPVQTGPGSGGATTTGIRVGVSAGNTSPFTGFIADLQVYDRALGATDARGLIDNLRAEYGISA